jgi:hypothetical protein
MIALAIACALCAAVASGVGARLQHGGVRAETRDEELRLRSLGRLSRNRGWRLGFAVLFAGTALQVTALTFAPVIVVAPLVVLALPVVAVLSGKAKLDRTSVLAVASVSVAVGVFVALSSGAAANPRLPPSDVLKATQIVAVVLAVLGAVAVVNRGMVRSVALSAAAGAAYGLVSVLVRDVAFTVRTLGLAELPWLALFGAVAAFLLGAWFVQLAYASGPPDVVVGCQTMVNPLVATVLGMTVLGEAHATHPLPLAALAACGAVAVTGIGVLSRRRQVVSSPSRRVRYSRST